MESKREETIKRFKEKAELNEIIPNMNMNEMTSEEFLELLKTLSIETEMRENNDNVEKR